MAKNPLPNAQPPKRRRHVAGQRRFAREQGVDVAAPPVTERGTAPRAPVTAPAPPTVPAAPLEQTGRLARLRLPRLRLSVPAGWRTATSPTVVAAVLLAAVVILATLGGLFFSKWQHGKAVADAKQDSVAAATAAMTNVLSYNYRTFDADVARAQAYLADVKGVGAFRSEYLKTTSTAVKDAAKRNKATVKADVVYAGVITASPTKATVLVFVDQTATNTALKAPRIDRNRIKLELRKIDGKWLVAKLTPL